MEATKPGDGGSAGLLKAFWISRAVYWSIAILLSTAVVLSTFLVSQHFGGGLPGCGPQSGCEALERTRWGTIPGLQWPVSFVGFAYFVAILVAWMVAGREVRAAAQWLIRVGGAASLLFIGVMLALQKFCPYCVGVHGANLAVVVLMEREMPRSARRALPGGGPMSWVRVRRIGGSALATFLAVSLLLGVANGRMHQNQLASAESDRRQATDKILAQAQAVTEVPAPEAKGDIWGGAGFTGRYRLGPEASPIRIVMLTDYQCKDCNQVEPEVEAILASRSDVSLSVKHYPMCAEAAPGVPCNKYAKESMHPNSCWAARAAEAAGILKGNDGFWTMHRWLFSRTGNFTDADLKAAVTPMGFSTEAFMEVMKGPETLRRVQADCDEGNALGLYFTPMIFINGVEFKGWQVSGALRRTIEEVAAKNPPALTATADRPALAGFKYVQDWRDQPARHMPPDTRVWWTGAASPSGVQAASRFVDVVLFGDYQEPYTAAMDLAIRGLMKSKPNVRYTFRHFPIDPKINTTLPANVRPEAIHPLAGRAAQAAEAAGAIGGVQAYWKMHDWLMRNLQALNDESLRAAAEKMGIDSDKLFEEMEKPEVTAAILEDARAAQQLGLTGVPMVFINGKWVWRTMRDNENIVLPIIEEAGKP